MQTHGSTNKSPIKLSMQRKINNTVICLRMGKTYMTKIPWVILRLPLLKLYYYHNKRLQVTESQYFIPIYSWTFTPIPNWTCFVVIISPFDAQLPSTWLTNCADLSTRLQSPTREVCWLQSSSVHPHDEDQEDTWSQNPTVHIHSNFFKRDELGQNFVSSHDLLEQTILKVCATCELFDGS